MARFRSRLVGGVALPCGLGRVAAAVAQGGPDVFHHADARVTISTPGLGAVRRMAPAWAYRSGTLMAGYILGAGLTGVAVLVSTTDTCIPSTIYDRLFRRARAG